MNIIIKGKTLKVQPRLGRALVKSRYAKVVEAPQNVTIMKATEPTTDPVETVLIADPEKSEQEQQEQPRQKRAYRRRDMTAEQSNE